MGCTVGFTYDLKSDHPAQAEGPLDALAELDAQETIDLVARALESGGHRVERIGNVRSLLKRLPDLDVDIVFNICEGVGHRSREAEVPTILEMFGVPYVGSDALTLSLTLDKVMTKKAFVADGVPTPRAFLANGKFSLKDLDGMKFPVIVKPCHEGSSKGISDDSLVKEKGVLKAQIAEVNRLYRQPAVVEEFIRGSEFTVLVIGNDAPEALEPVQIQIAGLLDLGDLMYTWRRLTSTDIEYICPAKAPAGLKRKLRDMAVAAYRAVDCRDFGRVDFRVDAKGRPYVLEVNPLPSLSDEDVFPMIAKAHAWTYEELLLKIVEIARQRYPAFAG